MGAEFTHIVRYIADGSSLHNGGWRADEKQGRERIAVACWDMPIAGWGDSEKFEVMAIMRDLIKDTSPYFVCLTDMIRHVQPCCVIGVQDLHLWFSFTTRFLRSKK